MFGLRSWEVGLLLARQMIDLGHPSDVVLVFYCHPNKLAQT